MESGREYRTLNYCEECVFVSVCVYVYVCRGWDDRDVFSFKIDECDMNIHVPHLVSYLLVL